MTYHEWIQGWLSRHKAYGHCREAVRALVASFPELKAVPGHVECPIPWRRRAHWWAVAPDGTVVDPTASQFPVIYGYEPFVPGSEVYTGPCYWCGCDIYVKVYSLDEPPDSPGVCGDDVTVAVEGERAMLASCHHRNHLHRGPSYRRSGHVASCRIFSTCAREFTSMWWPGKPGRRRCGVQW